MGSGKLFLWSLDQSSLHHRPFLVQGEPQLCQYYLRRNYQQDRTQAIQYPFPAAYVLRSILQLHHLDASSNHSFQLEQSYCQQRSHYHCLEVTQLHRSQIQPLAHYRVSKVPFHIHDLAFRLMNLLDLAIVPALLSQG